MFMMPCDNVIHRRAARSKNTVVDTINYSDMYLNNHCLILLYYLLLGILKGLLYRIGISNKSNISLTMVSKFTSLKLQLYMFFVATASQIIDVLEPP